MTDTCRICFDGGPGMVAPCACAGTQQWVHPACLHAWRRACPRAAGKMYCDVCHAPYEDPEFRITWWERVLVWVHSYLKQDEIRACAVGCAALLALWLLMVTLGGVPAMEAAHALAALLSREVVVQRIIARHQFLNFEHVSYTKHLIVKVVLSGLVDMAQIPCISIVYVCTFLI